MTITIAAMPRRGSYDDDDTSRPTDTLLYMLDPLARWSKCIQVRGICRIPDNTVKAQAVKSAEYSQSQIGKQSRDMLLNGMTTVCA